MSTILGIDVNDYGLQKMKVEGGGGGTVNLQSKTATPTTSQQVIEADTGYDGLDKVTVNGVTSAIDNNITAENIKKDVSILGVTGTYEGSGGSSFPPDWSQIGYSNTPDSLLSQFNISKDIYDNWDSSITSMDNLYYIYTTNQYIYYFPLVNTENVISMLNTFVGQSKLYEIPLLNTSNVQTMQGAFQGCSITSFPSLNTSNVTNMRGMLTSCSNLVSVPVLNTSKVTIMRGMFEGCSSLSNDSLNNILQMCINTPSNYSDYKTLARLGLTSAQATTCQSLSNWNAFVEAGWSTGY